MKASLRHFEGGDMSADLRQRMSFLKKRPRDPGQVVFAGLDHHEPLEVNVVDTSIGTGGGSCGEGADKSSPSTSGGHGAATTATASPRSLVATTASMNTPSHSPGFIDPDAIMTSNEECSPTPSPHDNDEVSHDLQATSEDVVLRRDNRMNGYRSAILKRNSYSTNEAGRLLKFCLERHFNQSEAGENEALDAYIREVFHQLDYHRCGTVSREDFDTLCEVLDLRPTSRPESTVMSPVTSNYRLSGLEWLSSYRPRSPMSPLRLDKLNEVKYRGPKRSVGDAPEPPNFLFTIGPRPFWEMWPQKKRRKRRLNINDFKRALLEQWAKTNGIASNRVSVLFSPFNQVPTNTGLASVAAATGGLNNGIHHRNHRHIRSVRVIPSSNSQDHPDAVARSQGLLASKANRNGLHYQHQQPQRSVHYETRTKRFFRRLFRVSRRVHFIRRLSRRIRRESIGPPLQPRIAINPALRPSSVPASSTPLINHHQPPPTLEKQKQRVLHLEKQVEHQQTEICGLRDVVQDLRSSLQLSDAQNLALQVLLKKMSKAEVQLPVMGHDSFRSQMDESEKHLENLVKELKEMSQTRYPRYLPNANIHGGSSSTTTSVNGGGTLTTLPDFVLEDEVQETSKVLGEASDELKAATTELATTVHKLQRDQDEEEFNLKEAYRALERAQSELNNMRIQLEEAQAALETTKTELNETRDELIVTQTSLRNSDMQLRDTEQRLSLLSQNRRSLVLELQTTRELLASSLKKVQDLELESNKVPALESRIHELERNLSKNTRTILEGTTTVRGTSLEPRASRTGPSNNNQVHHHHHLVHHLPHHLRPLSTVDSGLYSTSDSDHEDNCPNKPHDNSLEGVSDEDAAFADAILASHHRDTFRKLPPRPPSSIPKSPRPFTPIHELTPHCGAKSPSTSGHHSGGSKFSVSSPSASPSSVGKSPTPSSHIDQQLQMCSISPAPPLSSSSKTFNRSEEAILKLRKEISSLRERFANRQKDWAEERNMLLDELLKRRHQNYQLELQINGEGGGERVQLSLLEEKIKEVLTMLRSLNSMNISPKTLGKLVLDAVERSVDSLTGEIQVFKFLNHLYHSAREYERMSAESMIHIALQAVEAHSNTLAQIEVETRPKNFNESETSSHHQEVTKN